MSVQVGELAKGKQEETWVEEHGIGLVGSSGGVGRENPIGEVDASENPVVSAVAEDVGCGHGGQTETVDEDGFDFTFEEVDHEEDTG